MKYLLSAILSLSVACACFASDIQQQQSVLYPYRSTIQLQDEFLSGNITSGQIGNLGWGFAGGTVTATPSIASRIGMIRRSTGAVINTITQTILNLNTASAIDPANPTILTHVIRLIDNDADTQMRIGAANATGANPPTNGIYFEKLGADTTWFCITVSGGVQTRTNSTITTDTNFHTFSYTRNSSGVLFYIDNVLACPIQTTNITTTFIDPFAQMVNLVAVAKQYDMEYFEISIYGLVR